MSPNEPASESGDRVAALAVLYQSERQDSATILLTSLALIAAGMTYLGIAAVLLSSSKLPGGLGFSISGISAVGNNRISRLACRDRASPIEFDCNHRTTASQND